MQIAVYVDEPGSCVAIRRSTRATLDDVEAPVDRDATRFGSAGACSHDVADHVDAGTGARPVEDKDRARDRVVAKVDVRVVVHLDRVYVPSWIEEVVLDEDVLCHRAVAQPGDVKVRGRA